MRAQLVLSILAVAALAGCADPDAVQGANGPCAAYVDPGLADQLLVHVAETDNANWSTLTGKAWWGDTGGHGSVTDPHTVVDAERVGDRCLRIDVPAREGIRVLTSVEVANDPYCWHTGELRDVAAKGATEVEVAWDRMSCA